MHFCLLGTNGFPVKAKNERFTAVDVRRRQTSQYEFSRRHLVDYVKKLHQKACRTIIFPYSTNKIIDLWRCRGRCRRHFLNSILVDQDRDTAAMLVDQNNPQGIELNFLQIFFFV